MVKVGKHYNEWVHSPVNKKLRLFESDFIEAISKSPWWLVPLVWIPTILYLCWISMTAAPTYIPTLATAPPPGLKDLVFLPLMGILLWTFIEYSLHRFVFHLEVPRTGFASKLLIPFHFAIHGLHHKVSSRYLTIKCHFSNSELQNIKYLATYTEGKGIEL